MKNALEILGELIEFFTILITPEQTIKQKPNPEPIYLACKKLSIKPEESVYIGDTIRDYQTASTSKQFDEIGAKNQVISFNLIPDMIKKLQK